MAVQTTYPDTQPDAVAGARADMQPATIVSRTVEVVGIAFGVVLITLPLVQEAFALMNLAGRGDDFPVAVHVAGCLDVGEQRGMRGVCTIQHQIASDFLITQLAAHGIFACRVQDIETTHALFIHRQLDLAG